MNPNGKLKEQKGSNKQMVKRIDKTKTEAIRLTAEVRFIFRTNFPSTPSRGVNFKIFI